MIIMEGQRIKIERELVRELFRPTNSPSSKTENLLKRLASRGRLTSIVSATPNTHRTEVNHD